MAYVIKSDKCIRCGSCAECCPTGAVCYGYEYYSIKAERCISCGACEFECPEEAIYWDDAVKDWFDYRP